MTQPDPHFLAPEEEKKHYRKPQRSLELFGSQGEAILALVIPTLGE